jgi:succinate dehydrogenase / fumarate reductase cytochrome b subunit
MATLWKFVSSSIGTKFIIAVSGLCLFAFLVVHLAGNLLIFLGPEALNGWGHLLVSNPLTIPAEIGLALIFLIHACKAVLMWWDNRGARPLGYAQKKWAGHTSRKNVGSATMIVSGPIVFAFVVWHVLTFKFGPVYESAEPGVRDLSRLVVEAFSQPLVSGLYVVVMILIGLHLRHGIASALQSLGADGPRFTPLAIVAGTILAVLMGAGFAVIPIWVLLFR